MSMYAIKDTTLTALGDAVRRKKDNLKVAPYIHKAEALVYKSGTGTENLTLTMDDIDDLNGINLTPWIKVRVNSITNWQENGWRILHSSNSGMGVEIPYGTTFPIEFYCRYSWVSFYGYHTPSKDNPNLPLPVLDVEIWGCNENKEPYFYTPLEMAGIINELKVPTITDVVLSGKQSYGCAGPLSTQFIREFGDRITTTDITTMDYMFKDNHCEIIPFDINTDHSTYQSMGNMFSDCQKLKELPKIFNAYPDGLNRFFYNCYKLNNIPEDYFDTWNFNRIQTYSYAGASYVFYYCNSLRKVPKHLLDNLWGINSSVSSVFYYSLFNNCWSLDEVIGLAVQNASLTSNGLGSTFSNCYRLKDMTFQTNEDGTPKTAKWKSQTLDLSYNVGYTLTASNIINANNGITADKEVKDDATYQALKDDPDWFATNLNYSRYNHDSAVRTINSLPDCSATGTNTIKFKGACGGSTDGGAINTLTEEEIAVATAKGWTVSLV